MSEQHNSQPKPAWQDNEDEIDLLELWNTVLKYKRMIVKSVLITAVVTAAGSLLMPNIYRAEILLSPVQSATDSKAGLSSALGSLGGLGGLASMAGVSLGGGGVEENLAVLQSREFLWKFAQENKLMPILFEDEWDAQQKKWKETNPKKQPGQMDVYRLFTKEILTVNNDKKTDLITVSVEMEDAALASELANALVKAVNKYIAQQNIDRSERNLAYLNEELMRTPVAEMRQALFDLIASEQKNAMVANTQKDFAFKVLDPAVEPDKKAKPKRALIVILAAMLAGFIAVMYAFIKEGMAKRREAEVLPSET